MQSSVTLSQKDIERFNKAVTRLATLGASLLNSAARNHGGAIRRRRRRRAAAATVPAVEAPKAVPANGRRKRKHPLPPPSAQE